MLTFFTIILITYLLYGTILEYLNCGIGEKFRLMSVFDWPWLIYTKGVTTA